MAEEREHQEELSQGSSVNHPKMESINAENQVLKNQLIAINSEATYSYYYNPYVGYSAGTSTGDWQLATPVASMQPIFTPGDTPAANERRTKQRHTVLESEAKRQITLTWCSTPNLPPPPEGPIPQGTMNVEDMMRSIMFEEMRTLEVQMEQHFFLSDTQGNNFHTRSIDSFDEVSLEFMRSYSVHIQSGNTTKDLWGVVQGPHESFRTYIKHFSKAISEISGLDDGTVGEALKKGLRH
ncbi:hypothetical protein TIFTF001_020968 [Ficus carica]|uniref:Retrotransposon gag domain-containing protein n=1 Tax=Ficus carica TaxID=3494 RepID=A0AA88AYG4_FICCA|nr:hypothetical protein TIFTF001_020968 [Ficus carica]